MVIRKILNGLGISSRTCRRCGATRLKIDMCFHDYYGWFCTFNEMLTYAKWEDHRLAKRKSSDFEPIESYATKPLLEHGTVDSELNTLR